MTGFYMRATLALNELNILVLIKTKFNASKKRIKQTYEMRYMPIILPPDSNSYRQ